MKITKELVKASTAKAIQFASQHAPTALVGLGTAGFVVTVVTACKSTPKAIEAIEAAKKEKGEDLTIVETAKIGAKHYWKPALIGAVSIGCFVGAHSVDLKRQAALTAAYTLSERTIQEYKAKVIETLGETKADKIEDAIAEKKITSFPFTDVPVQGAGPLWIFAWTNTPFRGDLETIRRVVNDLNDDIYQCKGKAYLDGEIKLNDLLYELSLACNAPQLGSVSLGEQFGFRADLTGPINLNIRYGQNKLGEPCGFIDVHPMPLTSNIKDIYY